MTITVDTSVDERDFNIVSGDVSLRDAILEATAGETIVFSTQAVHALNGATINLHQDLREIAFNKSLTIDASMLEDGITIDAGGGLNGVVGNADGFRIFNITGSGSTLVTMKNLTLTGGDVRSENGGAILSTVSLALEDCSISENYASSYGGGLHFTGGSGSALTLKSTTINDNTCSGDGGGLYVSASNATVTIEDSTISVNTGQAGGIAASVNGGNFIIENSTILDNDALIGPFGAGALQIKAENEAEVALNKVRITENEAVDGIGGIFISNSNSNVTIADCTISENTGRSISANEVGGGLHIHGLDNSTTTIQNSTISGNELFVPDEPTPGYISGGGLNLEVDFGCSVVVRNTTISGNKAAGGGGGVQIGDWKHGGVVRFEHSTITLNHADAYVDDTTNGTGGGIFFEVGSTTTVELNHTIVAKNYRGSDTTTYDDISNPASNPMAAGWSLIGIDTGATITTVPNTTNKGGTSTFTDPMLGPLVYNGGPVFLDGSKLLTHAPLPDSPAIDQGDSAIAFSLNEYDQRGNPWHRVKNPVVNPRIDIGAIEWQANPLEGDYNFNGVVDAADYTVWRDALGGAVRPFSGADGNGDGNIDQADYVIWKTAYGSVNGLVLADFNGNGATDIADFNVWASTEGSTTDLRADCNEDGIVDEADYDIWFDTFGSTLAIAHFGLLSGMFDPDAPPVVVGFALGLPGDITVDFAEKVGSGEQVRSVPMNAANTLSVTFSQDVVVTQGGLTITNLNGTSPSVASFAYDAAAQTATWTFTTALADGRYLIRLADTVENLEGQALDGEFFNPTKLSDSGTSVFPSGDGDEGGEFRFRFTVLVGDDNHDNIYGTTNYTNWQSTEPGLIIVSTTADDWDADLSFGDVSLREAVNYVNTTGSATAIQLPAGRYTLSRTGTESTADVGVNDLDITANIAILGAGPGVSIIDNSGLGSSSQTRAFEINGSASRLRLSRLTVANGSSTQSGQVATMTGGATLEIVESAIVNHTAYAAGSAIMVTSANLVISRSVVTNNDNTSIFAGSAIYATGTTGNPASVTVGESIFALNAQPTYSGGTTYYAIRLGSSVTKVNQGKNLYDYAGGGFFDTTPGVGDYLGTPQYVVTSVGDTFSHADDLEALSLREAVDLANQASGAQSIWMPAWRFTLTRDRGANATDTDVSYGDIDVKDSTSIRGVAGRTSVDWKLGVVDKVFDLVGDSNSSGVVDAADYTLWQDQNGVSGAWEQYSADADDDGDVDANDYSLWQQGIGRTLTLAGIEL